MKLVITLNVEPDAEYVDQQHGTGLTEEGYQRLTSYTEHGAAPLDWLGEIEEVARADS